MANLVENTLDESILIKVPTNVYSDQVSSVKMKINKMFSKDVH